MMGNREGGMTVDKDQTNLDPIFTSTPRPGNLKKYVDYPHSQNLLASSDWLEMDWSQWGL